MTRNEKKAYVKEMRSLEKKIKKGICLSDDERTVLAEYRLEKRLREERIVGFCSILSVPLAVIAILIVIIKNLI